jgi:hypothetical protein
LHQTKNKRRGNHGSERTKTTKEQQKGSCQEP